MFYRINYYEIGNVCLACNVFDSHLCEQSALAVVEGELVLRLDVYEMGADIQ